MQFLFLVVVFSGALQGSNGARGGLRNPEAKEDLPDVERSGGDDPECQNDDDEDCGSGLIERDGLPSEVQPNPTSTFLLLDPLPTLPTSPSSKDWYGLPYMKRLMSNRRWEEMLEVPESEPIRREGQLVRELLSGYRKRGRPVINASEAVVVTFGATLQQIVNFDEEAGTITTNMWLNLEWNDPRLAWNESHANGIQDVRLNINDIWLPDIEIYNLVSKKALRREGEEQVVLRSTGRITWIPPYLVTTTCKIDHTYFPFDQQNCRLKFGSWSCSTDLIDLQAKEESLDLGTYVMNLDWYLESADGRKSEISYGPGATYQSMTYVISLKRRAFGLVSPALNQHNMVLIQSGLLTIANILSFLMPASHPSPRLLLHLVSLLALSITSTNLPQPSLMATLLGSCTFTLILATVHTVFMAFLANSQSLLLACNPIWPARLAVREGKEIAFMERNLKIAWWIDFAAVWTYLLVFTSYFLSTIVDVISYN